MSKSLSTICFQLCNRKLLMTQILYKWFAWNLCGLYIYTRVHPQSRADELVGSHEQLVTVILLNESDGLKMLYEQLSEGYELHSLVFLPSICCRWRSFCNLVDMDLIRVWYIFSHFDYMWAYSAVCEIVSVFWNTLRLWNNLYAWIDPDQVVISVKIFRWIFFQKGNCRILGGA